MVFSTARPAGMGDGRRRIGRIVEEDRKPPKANGGVATATATAPADAPAGRPDKDAPQGKGQQAAEAPDRQADAPPKGEAPAGEPPVRDAPASAPGATPGGPGGNAGEPGGRP